MDPVTRNAARSPMFILGAFLVLVGVTGLALWFASASASASSSGDGSSAFFWVLTPVGAILMALARARAEREWKRGR